MRLYHWAIHFAPLIHTSVTVTTTRRWLPRIFISSIIFKRRIWTSYLFFFCLEDHVVIPSLLINSMNFKINLIGFFFFLVKNPHLKPKRIPVLWEEIKRKYDGRVLFLMRPGQRWGGLASWSEEGPLTLPVYLSDTTTLPIKVDIKWFLGVSTMLYHMRSIA